MRISFRNLCLSVVAMWLAFSSGAYAQLGRTFDKGYRVQGHAELQVAVDEGSVTSESCGGCTEVRVHLDMRGADPAKYELKESQQGNTVRFELKRRSFFGWNSGSSEGPEITVRLPKESDVKLTSGSGSLLLRGVHGREELNAGSGSVDAENVSGTLHAGTGSGVIRLHEIDAVLEATTGSGTIEAGGRVQLHKATAGSGNIRLALAEGSMLDSEALVETGSGSVELRLSRSIRADLQVRTGSGSFHSDLPLTMQGDLDKHFVRGTLNGGGPTLRLQTGSGNIAIRSL